MQYLTRRTFVGAGLLAAGCGRTSRAGFSGFAFVANEEGHAIAAVDLTAFAVVRHLRLDAAPTQLVSHPGRKMVYALTPATGTIHEISAGKLQRVRWKALGSAASHLRLHGGSLWVLLKSPRQLVEVRLESLEPVRRIALPEEPFDLHLADKQPLALVSFGASGKAAVVNRESGRMRVLDCGSPIGRACFRGDGAQWMAAHPGQKQLSFFDVESGKVVVRLPLAVRPDNFCFKKDGGQLFITGDGADAVAIVYPFWTEVAETVLAGRAPAAMESSPRVEGSPELLFVTNPKSGQVTVIDIESRKPVAVVQVGAEPSHVVITPDNQYVLVLNRQSGDMAVFLRESARRSKWPIALLTMIPVGSRPVSAVVQAV